MKTTIVKITILCVCLLNAWQAYTNTDTLSGREALPLETSDGVKSKHYFTSGTQVAIQADLDRWISRCVNCQPMAKKIRNTASAHMGIENYPRAYETFTWYNYNGKVALKADNGFFLKACYHCASEDPTSIISIEPLPQGQKDPSGDYLFTVKALSNGKFTFQSSNGRYWTRFYRGSGAKMVITTYRPKAGIKQAEFEIKKLRNVKMPVLDDEKNHVLKDVKKTTFDKFTVPLHIPELSYPYNQASWHITRIKNVNDIKYHQGKHVVGRDDHPNGMTMTKSGRIIFDFSRIKTQHTNEGGAIIYSSPGSLTNLQRDSWSINTSAYPVRLGSTGKAIYNDKMQAVGEVLMISGSDNKTHFYKIKGNNQFTPLPHLSSNLVDKSFVAIAYSPVDERYFALYPRSGGTKNYSSRDLVEMEVWATEKGRSLRNPNTRFYPLYTIKDIPLSQQGAHLIVQEDGTLFLLNAFVFEPDDITTAGITSCADITGVYRPWQETLALTRLYVPGSTSNQQGTYTWTKKIGIVPHPVSKPCIDVRPSWRYAGAFTATGPSSAVFLWSARWRSTIKDDLEETYEYASRVLR
jgi:hypothetical protein